MQPLRPAWGGQPLPPGAPPSPWTHFDYSGAVSAQARTGITMAKSGPAVTISVQAGLSADANFSTGAYLWWRNLESLTRQPVELDDTPRIVFPLIEFASLPDDGSNVEIGIAVAPSADRTSHHNIMGGNFASSRLVFGARHLSGTTADTVDTGGLGAFSMVCGTNYLIAATNTLVPSTYTVLGYAGSDHRLPAAWDPGASPWDRVDVACNITEGDYIGLAARAVGTTTATQAVVRLWSLTLRMDR